MWWGQGGAFSPSDLTNLLAWYDASDITTLWQDDGRTTQVSADDDAIGAWDDKSGNGEHVTQATAANRPTYKTGIVNSLPVVRCDGTNDKFTASIPQSDPVHIYAVLDTTRIASSTAKDFMRDGGNVLLQLASSDRDPAVWSGAGAGEVVQRLAVVRWRAETAGTGVRIDDGTEQTGAAVGISGDWTNFLAGITFADYDCGEVVMTGSITADEDTVLLAYLNDKWAIY